MSACRKEAESMKNKTGLFLVMAVVFFCSTFGNAWVSFAATMPSCAWLRTITAASPVAVALDREDNFYVADSIDNVVNVYGSNGVVVGGITGLAKPISVAVDGNGRVYVGNAATQNVMVFDSGFHFLFALGAGDGEFKKPAGIAVDDFGTVYVADSAADLIKVYNASGVYQYSFGGSGSGNGHFHTPVGVIVNEAVGKIVVVDRQLVDTGNGLSEAGRVQIFEMNGTFRSSFGEPSPSSTDEEMKTQGMLAKPTGVTVDSFGRIYVTDTHCNIVQVYDSSGSHLGYVQDVEHRLRTPVDLAVSRLTGRLYVASLSGGVVDVFGGGVRHTVSVVAGAGGVIIPSGEIIAEQGEKISFSVTADSDYRLGMVTVDGVVEDVVSDSFNLIVSSDHAVVAEFVPADTFFFAANTSANGDVTFSGGTSVTSGSDQTVTVTPRAGYRLVDLIVDGVSVWGQVVDNSYTFTGVNSDHTVSPIFEVDPDVALNIVKAANYLEGDVSTYPILADGGEEVFTVTGGTSGVFNWFVYSADGDMVWWYYATGASFTVPVDELFANGAGVYTVEVEDRYASELSPATMQVRVPMRIVPKFANYGDTEGNADFAVTGAEGAFTWSLLDEAGQVLADPVFGVLGGSTTAENTLTLQAGIAAVTSFQVQARIADPVLAAAGLDTVIAGPQVVMPMRHLAVQVDDGSSPLADVVISAVHDQNCATVTDSAGTAVLPELAATGANYAFAVQRDGYMPVVVATTDFSVPLTVSLDAIANPVVVSGTILPAGPATQVRLLRADDTEVVDSHGNPVQVLADVESGTYSLSFDSTVAGTGPYRVVATRPGFITNLEENEGVVDAVAGETGKYITLHEVTHITVAADGGSPVTFSITATQPFNGVGSEVQAFAGTTSASDEVTSSLLADGAAYTYTVPAPVVGEALNLFVRADTSAARTAASGYFATFGVEYLLGLNAPEESVIANPQSGADSAAVTSSGNSAVALPAGGFGGEVLADATLVMTEADPSAAGLGLISCSEIVDLGLRNTATGEAVANEDIHNVYVTVKFDPGKVRVGDFESGVVVICYAADIADLRPGVATLVPVNRIVKPINYGAGKVTFRVENMGAYGIGGARGGAGDVVGLDPAIRYIGTARGWTDSGPDDFWDGK